MTPPRATQREPREAVAEDEAGDDGLAPLSAGLHVVATPIGNARDVTLRALDALAGADAIAAEDTRRTRTLMEMHGVALGRRSMISYNDHNAPARRPGLLARLAAGESVALVTDAGTPLVADPGWRLVSEAIAAGHAVHALPGASAALAALCVSGLPTDRFLFAGFPPVKSGERARWLAEIAGVRATLVFYEAPRRLAESLAAMTEAFGAERPAAVARELTKRHEEVRRGALGELAAAYAAEGPPKGEAVVLVGPPGEAAPVGEAEIDAALREALVEMSTRDAVTAVSEELGLPRKVVYARALSLGKGE